MRRPSLKHRALTALGRADDVVGTGLEWLVVEEHRLRLRRHGRLGALDTPAGGWAGGEPPPRAGNALEVLVDGADALPRIAEAIEGARSHVHVAGWHLAPAFDLRRDGSPACTVRDILGEAASRVDVRVLVWAGAPLPVFTPSRADVRRGRDALVAGTRIRCALDARERPMHCHHEKLVIVDDELAFVGGIDLTDLAGDRFDTNHHRERDRLGWHDAAALVRGPAVADVAVHFALRWREVVGEELEAPATPAAAGETDVQVVRTVPNGIYDRLPDGDYRILESYLRALRSAERLVYLENQYLWSPEIVAVLADKLRRPPQDGFRVVLVLPAKPYGGEDDTRGQLSVLATADHEGGGGRLLACALYAGHELRPDAVYVHAKVGIVDDRWLTVGSANLNEHSLFNDSEMNVVTHDAGLARSLRRRLWSEHLELGEDELADDPTACVDDQWTPIASEQLGRRLGEARLTHRLVRLPTKSKRAGRLLGPLQGLLVDG